MSESATIDERAVDEPIVVPKKKKRQHKQEKQDDRPKRQPPYAVIVHNDEQHTFPYVIELLQKVCGHSPPKAVQLTFQIHVSGKAIVWSGPLEVAELKRDQIRGHGPDFYALKAVRFPLGVTIEPLPSD